MLHGRWLLAKELQAALEKPAPEFQRTVALESEFVEAVSRAGAARAIEEYKGKDLPRSQRLSEVFLNSLGYRLLGGGKTADAVAVFKFNTELYPGSWNTYDSLAEAYVAAGEKALAIENYRRAVALNPRDAGAAEAVKRLQSSR